MQNANQEMHCSNLMVIQCSTKCFITEIEMMRRSMQFHANEFQGRSGYDKLSNVK